ncbi:MAG TPA: dihydrodipicolinate reductase [Anaeromyxobacteraceae bacterium]|nr:dihydrodipicolinate reductase [Anaeromyxobacteraceae bacterium]
MADRGNGIPVVVMGLGDIGRAIARAVLAGPDLRLVAAVDRAPALHGQKLEELLGVPCPGIPVYAEPSKAFAAARGGVVLQATTSSFQDVLPQIEQALGAGLSVVSTCEELAFPWLRFKEEADGLDRLCLKKDLGVIGVGVNPGFALDRLPAFLSQVAGPVRHIRGVRVVDAARRRPALQRKVGASLSEEVFDAAVDRGDLGHIGLAESAALAALGCGMELDEVEEEIEPILAERDHDSAVPVKKGQVAGMRQVATGFVDGKEVVRLDVTIAVGAADPRDEVELDADPPVKVQIPGGLAGDQATAWLVVNAAGAIGELRGLVTVLDLPSGR